MVIRTTTSQFKTLAIHPSRAINGYGLYLQNGTDQDATNPPDVEPDDNDYESFPSGGSNQQYGAQIINVHILSDDNKPNDEDLKRSNAAFFNYPLSLINFGRPRSGARHLCGTMLNEVVPVSPTQKVFNTGLSTITHFMIKILVILLKQGTHPGYGFKPEELVVLPAT